MADEQRASFFPGPPRGPPLMGPPPLGLKSPAPPSFFGVDVSAILILSLLSSNVLKRFFGSLNGTFLFSALGLMRLLLSFSAGEMSRKLLPWQVNFFQGCYLREHT